MQIGILLIVIALMPTLAAWHAWILKDRVSLSGPRKVLFVAGLVGASSVLALYLAFIIHIYQIGGFGTDFPAMLRWARPGFWLSISACLLSLTGKSKSRAWTVVASLLLLVLWIIPIWGM
jgi:hypothetical protein